MTKAAANERHPDLHDPEDDATELVRCLAESDVPLGFYGRRAGTGVTITPNVTRLVPSRCLVCKKPFKALRRSAKTCSDACRQALSRTRRAATPPLPIGPFDLIVADPPWHFLPARSRKAGLSGAMRCCRR